MGKIISLGLLWTLYVSGSQVMMGEDRLSTRCLACHLREDIPNALVYRRYLMKYSTPKAIEQAMVSYLKNPIQKNSIMPSPFFLKFSMKPPLEMQESEIEAMVKDFIKRYDLRKRLILPPN